MPDGAPYVALPSLFLALAVTTALGRSETNVGLSLAIVAWPGAARVIRSAVLSHKSAAYVEAAQAVGAGLPRILFRHIMPNVASVYIVLATAGIAQAILVEASLSFLGVGVRPPEPSWGSMLLDASRYAVRAPYMAIFPGVAITLAVFGFNLFATRCVTTWTRGSGIVEGLGTCISPDGNWIATSPVDVSLGRLSCEYLVQAQAVMLGRGSLSSAATINQSRPGSSLHAHQAAAPLRFTAVRGNQLAPN